MSRPEPELSLKAAREVLGVSSLSTPDEIHAAFREAVKRAHPDQGGDEAAFRQVLDAYERLRNPEAEPAPARSAASAGEPAAATLEVSPQVALEGGRVEYRELDGRLIRIKVPAGLRGGDRIRAAGRTFTIYIRAEAGVLVRGDDLWLTVKVTPAMLKRGGRVALDTPMGRRHVWIDAKAAGRRLIRLEGQGLPARGRHGKGHMFLRLAAESARADGPALALIRRFTAAWA
jgi:curved DNA-binding protein